MSCGRRTTGVSGPARFYDRAAGGRALASALDGRLQSPGIVLALPRGGVPVGFEIATRLRRPLDVLVVRKLGVPGQGELAMGAIAREAIIINERVMEALTISKRQLEDVLARERDELQRREKVYRGDRDQWSAEGMTAILVDDGLATGSTMLSAIEAVKTQQPSGLIVAVPVGAASVCEMLRLEVDEVICIHSPNSISSIGEWYEDFTQTTDEEVNAFLQRARTAQALGDASSE